MKLGRITMVAALISLLMSVQTFAKINITKADISGDDNLKNKVISLMTQDRDYISSDAVYVAVDGVDSSSRGSIDKPYATVDYAIRKLASPSTVIYVRGGVYDQKIAVRQSGNENNYITVKAYPNEKPVFEVSSTGRIIDPNKNSYLVFDGLTLKAKGNSVSSSTHGVEMVQGSHIIFRNLEIYNINVPDPTSSSVSTHAFNFHGSNADTPISNIVVENCYIHDMQTGWSEALTVNGNAEYVSVLNCTIKDIGNIGLDFAGNFGACKTATLDQARYCVARGNVVSGCISPNARSYGLYNDGGRNNTFDRNIVYGCSGGIEIGSEEGGNSGKQNVTDITVTNNLVYNNIEVGVSIGGYSTTNSSVGDVYNTKLYNNTIMNNGEKEVNITRTVNCDVRNNIIYTPGAKAVNISFSQDYVVNFNINNNIYYSTDGKDKIRFYSYGTSVKGISNWIDANGVFADPDLDDNYMPKITSPSVDFGDTSVDVGSFDLNGNQRVVNTIDAGCYEYMGTQITASKGDANGDNEINNDDVTHILNYVVGNTTEVSNQNNADVNQDNKVTVRDASKIKKYLLGKISEL